MGADSIPKSTASDTPVDINKEIQSQLWRRNQAWRDKLYKSVCHQALDTPEIDDMQNVGNKSGMTWKELAVIGLVLIAGGWVAKDYINVNQQQTTPTSAPASVDSEYEVRFFDQDGNPINVPNVNEMP